MSNPLIIPEKSTEGGTEDLQKILDDLNRACKDIQLSMVSTRDGLTMTSLGSVLDPDRVGAMCSEFLAVCEKTAIELQRGTLQQMLVKCSDGCLVLMSAGDQAVLAIMTRQDANLGMIFLEGERAVDSIVKAL